jgi:hypothetical protein
VVSQLHRSSGGPSLCTRSNTAAHSGRLVSFLQPASYSQPHNGSFAGNNHSMGLDPARDKQAWPGNSLTSCWGRGWRFLDASELELSACTVEPDGMPHTQTPTLACLYCCGPWWIALQKWCATIVCFPKKPHCREEGSWSMLATSLATVRTKNSSTGLYVLQWGSPVSKLGRRCCVSSEVVSVSIRKTTSMRQARVASLATWNWRP